MTTSINNEAPKNHGQGNRQRDFLLELRIDLWDKKSWNIHKYGEIFINLKKLHLWTQKNGTVMHKVLKIGPKTLKICRKMWYI